MTITMPLTMRTVPRLSLRSALACLVLAVPCVTALAQYKVVRPDGSVTYTDRPPVADTAARVTPMRAGSSSTLAPGAADSNLPPDLRQAAQRYPVTLFTTADCQPCDAGRRLLQQRGVPYTERRVASEEDATAMERLAGGRTVPAATIGAQQLRGFSESDWTLYLDAAGYPRESKLPRNWPTPVPTPLVDRSAAAAVPAVPATPQPRPAVPQPQAQSTEPLSPSGVRF